MERKTVIVTGGSRGIGAAISKRFAREGYNISINYIKNDEEANKIKKEIESKYNVEVLLVKADVSNETDVENLIIKTSFNIKLVIIQMEQMTGIEPAS